MANQLPQNLYTGNAVVGNAMPYVQYANQLKQKRQAKDEAVDKYYQNLPNTINDKGVRDQEIPLIHQKKDEIQKYWMENRDKIRKGNTPEAYNLSKMFRETQGMVQESKNRVATATKVGQLRGNPKYDYIFKNPTLINQIEKHDLPVGTQGSEAIDFNQITLPPAPFEQKKYQQAFSDVKPEITKSVKPHPQDKYLEIEVSTPSFNKKQLDLIHQRAATELFNNPSFEDQIKNKIQETPDLLPVLNKTFEDNYGHPIANESDLATAYTLANMNLAPTEKAVTNWKAREGAKNAEWDRRRKLSFADSMKKIKANKEAGNLDEEEVRYITDENVINHGKEFPANLEEQAKKIFGFKPAAYIEAKDIDPRDLDVIIGQDKSKTQPGVHPITFENKKVYLIQEDGNWRGQDGKIIDREAVKDAWLKGKTKQTIQIGSKGDRNTISPKIKGTKTKMY